MTGSKSDEHAVETPNKPQTLKGKGRTGIVIEPKRIEFSGRNLTGTPHPTEKGQKTIDQCLKKGSKGTNVIIDVEESEVDVVDVHSSTGVPSKGKQVVEGVEISDRHVVGESSASGALRATRQKRDLSFIDDDEQVELDIVKKRKKWGAGKVTKSKEKIQYEDLLRRNKKTLDDLSVQLREKEGLPVTPRKEGQHSPVTPKFRVTKKFKAGNGDVEFETKVKPPVSLFRAFQPPDDLDIKLLQWNGPEMPGLEDGLGMDQLKPEPDVPWTACRHIWNNLTSKHDSLMNEIISLFPDTIIISYISNR